MLLLEGRSYPAGFMLSLIQAMLAHLEYMLLQGCG